MSRALGCLHNEQTNNCSHYDRKETFVFDTFNPSMREDHHVKVLQHMRLPILFGDVDSFRAATSWACNAYFDPLLTWIYRSASRTYDLVGFPTPSILCGGGGSLYSCFRLRAFEFERDTGTSLIYPKKATINRV